MAQSNYQEPIEKEDLDLKKKFSDSGEIRILKPKSSPMNEEISNSEKLPSQEKEISTLTETTESPVVESAETPSLERETGGESQEEKVSEKIETVRKAITTQKAPAVATVSDDAKTVAGIAEYEKKVEKLVELALHRGPEHAIKVAQHMDANDNYTLDELHDKMIEDDLRKQLIAKGLLKEL
jgi:hypothetical protein